MRGDRLVLQLSILTQSILYSLSFKHKRFLSLLSLSHLSCSCRCYSCHLISYRSISVHHTTATYLPTFILTLSYLPLLEHTHTHTHTHSKSQPGGSGSNGSSSKFTHTSDAAMVDHVAMSLSSLYVSVRVTLTVCYLSVTLLSLSS